MIPTANLPRLKYDVKINILLTTWILLAFEPRVHTPSRRLCHRYQSMMYANSFDRCQGWHVLHSRLSHSAIVQESSATVAHGIPDLYSSDWWQRMPPRWYLFQNTSQEFSHLALKISRSIRSRDALASDMDWEWHWLQYFQMALSEDVDKTDKWRDWNVNLHLWSWTGISVLLWHRQITSRRRRRPWIQYHAQKHHLDKLHLWDMGVYTGLR